MRRAFDLTFNTPRGDFRVGVNIEKSFTDRISFKTGYQGQPVKWIKVTTKEPDLERVTSRKEISHVVQADELESLWPSGEFTEDGEPEYVVVDKSSLKMMFPSGPEMRVLKTVPLSAVPFHTLEGSHYFLNVKKSKKGKTRVSNPEDEAMYNLVYQGLLHRSEALIVTYNAMNTNKHAVVYANKGGLRLANLIGSNYQKSRKEKQTLNSDIKIKLYDNLVGPSRQEKLGEYKDDYGEKLEELAQAAMRGETISHKEKPKLGCFARLSALDDSESDEEDSDEEESDKTKKRQISRDKSKDKKKSKYEN